MNDSIHNKRKTSFVLIDLIGHVQCAIKMNRTNYIESYYRIDVILFWWNVFFCLNHQNNLEKQKKKPKIKNSIFSIHEKKPKNGIRKEFKVANMYLLYSSGMWHVYIRIVEFVSRKRKHCYWNDKWLLYSSVILHTWIFTNSCRYMIVGYVRAHKYSINLLNREKWDKTIFYNRNMFLERNFGYANWCVTCDKIDLCATDHYRICTRAHVLKSNN